MSVLQGQKWTSDILFKQSKSSLAKSSSKLSFVNRFRGKKHKLQNSSSKILQDTSNTREAPQSKVLKTHANMFTKTHRILSQKRLYLLVEIPDLRKIHESILF